MDLQLPTIFVQRVENRVNWIALLLSLSLLNNPRKTSVPLSSSVKQTARKRERVYAPSGTNRCILASTRIPSPQVNRVEVGNQASSEPRAGRRG